MTQYVLILLTAAVVSSASFSVNAQSHHSHQAEHSISHHGSYVDKYKRHRKPKKHRRRSKYNYYIPGSPSVRPYNFIPKGGYEPTTEIDFVEASPDQILESNERVADIFGAAQRAETLVQRITENSYWVFSGNYTTVFYVGSEGVLLMDPLDVNNSGQVLEAIQSVTDKPVTAVVYSHSHADHIGGINVFVDAAQQQNVDLRIIASSVTNDKLLFLDSELPDVTDVVPAIGGSVAFENLTLTAKGFERSAHTDDSTMWLLEEEAILHIPDYLDPDQMHFLDFGVSENYVYYRQNLQTILDADWTILSAGHGNLGNKKDVQFMLDYLSDLETAVATAAGMLDFGKLLSAQSNNHHALVHTINVEQAYIATNLLRPKYGKHYGFEASVPFQAGLVAAAMISYTY